MTHQQAVEITRRAIGRWALPSGAAFAIYRTDLAARLVLCGNGRERWQLSLQQIGRLFDGQQLRYLGRVGR